jgi:hypothetical protein
MASIGRLMDDTTRLGTRSNERRGRVLGQHVYFETAEAASTRASAHIRSFGIRNSAVPQAKQTNSSEKTRTIGLLRPANPGKWMAISPLNLGMSSEPHNLQFMIFTVRRPCRQGAKTLLMRVIHNGHAARCPVRCVTDKVGSRHSGSVAHLVGNVFAIRRLRQ